MSPGLLSRPIPNYIQETNFFSSVPMHNLRRIGGFEFVGIYEFLFADCLKDPTHYDSLVAGDFDTVSSLIGVHLKTFQRFVAALLEVGLAVDSGGSGVRVPRVEERRGDYEKLCNRNRRNRVSPAPPETNKTEGLRRPVVNESLRSGDPLVHEWHTHTPIYTKIPPDPEGGPGGTNPTVVQPSTAPPRQRDKPLGPPAVIENIGELQLEALKMRFKSENLGEADLTEALWHAAGKLTENPDFHCYSWLSRYGPEHARSAKTSKLRLAAAQKIDAKTTTGPPKNHASFRPVEPVRPRREQRSAEETTRIKTILTGVQKQLVEHREGGK